MLIHSQNTVCDPIQLQELALYVFQNIQDLDFLMKFQKIQETKQTFTNAALKIAICIK